MAVACNQVLPDMVVAAAAVDVVHMDLEYMTEPEGVGIQRQLEGAVAEAMVERAEVGTRQREVVEAAGIQSPVEAVEGVGRDFHTRCTWCRILDL